MKNLHIAPFGNSFFEKVSRKSAIFIFRLKITEKQAEKAVGKRFFPISDLRGVKIVSRFLGILDFRLKSSRKAVFPISRLTRKEEGLIVGQIETQIRLDVRLSEEKCRRESAFGAEGIPLKFGSPTYALLKNCKKARRLNVICIILRQPLVCYYGGEGGIRTLETLLGFIRFPVVRARPGYATSPFLITSFTMLNNCTCYRSVCQQIVANSHDPPVLIQIRSFRLFV